MPACIQMEGDGGSKPPIKNHERGEGGSMTPIKNHERDEEGEGGFKLINIMREMGEEREDPRRQ